MKILRKNKAEEFYFIKLEKKQKMKINKNNRK